MSRQSEDNAGDSAKCANLSPLKPFLYMQGSLSTFRQDTASWPALLSAGRSLLTRGASRRGPALASLFEPHDGVDKANATAAMTDADVDSTADSDGAAGAGPAAIGPAEAEAFNGRRRRVKRKASRIARPKDAMPGYRRGKNARQRMARGGRGGSARGSQGAAVAIGKSYLNRGVSVAAYYGKDVVEGAQEQEEDLANLDLGGQAVELDVPRCIEHGLHCAKFTVKKAGPNKGRSFYKCAHARLHEQCSYFVWADEAAEDLRAPEEDSAAMSDVVPVKTLDPSAVDEVFAPAVCKVNSVEEQVAALRKYFGHSSFRPGQAPVLQSLLEGESTMAVLPTGGGKSLCYQLFALARPGVVIVITPLISLMLDQLASLPTCLAGGCLRSGQDFGIVKQTEERLLAGDLKILFVSPERLFSERFKALMDRLSPENISLLVVDEAHCISEMGHNFRPSYLRLRSFRGSCDESPPLLRGGDHGGDQTQRQNHIVAGCMPAMAGASMFARAPVLAMTATATCSVVRDVCLQLGIEQSKVIKSDTSRWNLLLTVTKVGGSFAAKASELVSLLRRDPFRGILLSRSSTLSRVRSKRIRVQAPKTLSGKRNKTSSASELVLEDIGLPISNEQKVITSLAHSTGAKTAADDAMGESDEQSTNEIAQGAIVVYVSKQRDCESLCNYLRASQLGVRINIEMYHAGMQQSARAAVQCHFEQGKISVLVATIAFGMGIHNDDIRGVIHFDIPFSIEAYAQEIGRAGRDGNAAACHVFLNDFDAHRLQSRAHADGVDVTSVRQFVRGLFVPEVIRSSSRARNGPRMDENSDLGEADTPVDCKTVPVVHEKTRLVCFSHQWLEADLDLRPETCETICTYIERQVPSFKLLPAVQGTVRIRFFSKNPGQLLEEKRGISELGKKTLTLIVHSARVRNGIYELALYKAGKELLCADLPPEDVLRGLRELKAGRHVDFDLSNPTLAVHVASGANLGVREVNDLVAVAMEGLTRIERTRRSKADALLKMLHEADRARSVQDQSKFLHDGIREYFEKSIEEDDDATIPPSACQYKSLHAVPEAEARAVSSAVVKVLDARAYGNVRARSPRQIARILHGIQSPAFPAKEWCRCEQWGRFIHIDFYAVKSAAADVVRARSLVGPPEQRKLASDSREIG